MQPSLGLFYSGSTVNGPVGYGWAIQGMSMITRCSGSKLIDKYVPVVSFGVNDKLCLDGQRLLQTDLNGNVLNNSGTAVCPSGTNYPFQCGDSSGLGAGSYIEYRTETDSFARIRAYGAAGSVAGNGPAYFMVWTKSGQIYEYGINSNTSSNAQINAEGSGVITAWPVSRISDTVGNYIDFQYSQRDVAWGSSTSTGHEWNLAEIRYTGNVNTGQLPTNKVVFTYADRPNNPGGPQDRSEAYHMGSKNLGIQLLQSIVTYINWPSASQTTQPATAVAVKNLKLGYQQGTNTNRSLLQTITECTGAGTICMPPTTFNYSGGSGAVYASLATFQSNALSWLPMINNTSTLTTGASTLGVITGNFFGSGKLDVIRWSDNPVGNLLYQNMGGGNFVAVPGFNITTTNLFRSDGCYSTIAADFNGDGLTDLLRIMTNPSCGTATNILYLSKGDGTFTSVTLPAGISFAQVAQNPTSTTVNTSGKIITTNTFSAGSNFHILDVNNDGLLDIVTTIMPYYSYTSINGVATTMPTGSSLCASQICTHVYLGQPGGGFVEQTPNNLNNQSVYAPPYLPQGQQFNLRPYVGDVNGDGISDLMVNSGIWISRGDGNFDLMPNTANLYGGGGCQYPLDFNGDGKVDCLIVGNDAAANQSMSVGVGPNAYQVATNFNLNVTGDELFGTTTATPARQNIGIQLVDVDGDGRTDIIRWEDNPANNMVYLSNGDGTFRTSVSGLAGFYLQTSGNVASFVTGDFTGNGNTEILDVVANPTEAGGRNWLFGKANPTPPDQLESVVSSTGLTTTLTWVTLANSSSGSLGNRYTSDRGSATNAAVYPMEDAMFPMYVVATSTTQTGTGGTVSTEYAYIGAKYAFDGRGWLGFRNTKTQNLAPNGNPLTQSTQYLMTTPYIGMPWYSEMDVGALTTTSPQVLSASTTIYCDISSTTAATSAAAQTPCQTYPMPLVNGYRPYVYQSTSAGTDLNGTPLPTVTTTNIYNTTGDPTQITVSTTGTAAGLTDTFSKITTNSFLTPNTSGNTWILGRLLSSTVASTVTNDIGNIPTSAGHSTWATAIWSNGVPPVVTPPPAISPTAKAMAIKLMPILSSYMLLN